MSARADYPAESYQLDMVPAFVKWRGNEQEIDFTSDAKLRQVTEIAPNAFAYKGNIQRIVFPASLRKTAFLTLSTSAAVRRRLSLRRVSRRLPSEAFTAVLT